MLVSRTELVDALRLAVAVVDSQNPVAILQYVCFTDGTIQASDGITGIVTKSPSVAAPFCTSGSWLMQLLDKLPDDQVDMEVRKSTLFVKSGRHSSKIPTVDASRYPNLLQQVQNTEPVDCQSGLSQALHDVLSITAEAKQLNLQGVGLHRNFVYASDGDRVTRSKWVGDVPFPVILPRQSAQLMSRYGDPKTLRVWKNGGLVLATYEGFLLTSRVLATKLPIQQIDLMIESCSSPANSFEFPDGVSKAIERVRLLGGDGGITIACNAGKLKVSREKSECVSEEDLDFANGPDFSFSGKDKYLSSAFSKFRTCDLSSVLVGRKNVVRFHDRDVLDHLVALIT